MLYSVDFEITQASLTIDFVGSWYALIWVITEENCCIVPVKLRWVGAQVNEPVYPLFIHPAFTLLAICMQITDQIEFILSLGAFMMGLPSIYQINACWIAESLLYPVLLWL